MKKTVLIAIAFGTSVRDVLRNDTFYLLRKNKNLKIVIVARENGKDFIDEFGGDNIYFENIVPVKVTRVETVLLNFHKALIRDKSKTIDLGNTSGGKKRMIDFFTPIARTSLKIFGNKLMHKFIYLLYKYFAPPTEYKDVFNKYNPDLVVVSRVLNYSADYPVMRRAAAEKIPIIALVSSWDNLTSKGFFPFSLRSIVVWNEIMKMEAIDLFQFPGKKIYISGIPRYDIFFREDGFRDKQQFLKYYNISANDKIITYGTGSSTTGKSIIDTETPEPEIVKYIADCIVEGKIQPSKLIVRLHPQANPDHYAFLADLNEVILQIPGKKSKFQDRLFSEEEDRLYGETLKYSDLVINLASTVTIDAAVFDTPIVCVNFDFRGERPYKYSVKRFYHFNHYANLVETNGFLLSTSREQLLDHINTSLENPSDLSEGRKEIVKQQCYYTDGNSGKRIADFILEALNSK